MKQTSDGTSLQYVHPPGALQRGSFDRKALTHYLPVLLTPVWEQLCKTFTTKLNHFNLSWFCGRGVPRASSTSHTAQPWVTSWRTTVQKYSCSWSTFSSKLVITVFSSHHLRFSEKLKSTFHGSFQISSEAGFQREQSEPAEVNQCLLRASHWLK